MAARAALPFTLLVLSLAVPAAPRAQGTSVNLDPSVRAAGMGGASGAVFWGVPNAWANPALIAYCRGVRYEWSNTELFPDFILDAEYESEIWTAGAWGIGLLTAGKPFEGLGDQRLHFGEFLGVDPPPEVTRSWGFGVSAAELSRSIARLAGDEAPGPTRWMDVAFGMRMKEVADVDFGESVTLPGFTAYDLGLAIRVTPYAGGEGRLPARIDLAYGYSDLSRDAPSGPGIYVARQRRNAFAVRASSPVPVGVVDMLEGRGLPWLTPGLSPFFSLGIAFDHNHLSDDFSTQAFGAELEVARVVSLRGGWYEDSDENIAGATWGVGVALPFGEVATVRWDYGRFPNAEVFDIDDRIGQAFTGSVDVAALWSLTRGSGEAGTGD